MEDNFQDCHMCDAEEGAARPKQVSQLAFSLAGRSVNSPSHMDRDCQPTPRDSIRTPSVQEPWQAEESSGTSLHGNGASGAFHMKVNAKDFDGKKNWGECNNSG